MKVLYLIDTQNLFYGARLFGETIRVDYKKLIPNLIQKYGTGDLYAFILITDYCNNSKFISLLKNLNCNVKRYYADIKSLLHKNNKIKIDWGEWLLGECIKLNLKQYDRIVIVSGAGVFIRLLQLLDKKIDTIVLTFKEICHKNLSKFCYSLEYLDEKIIFDPLSNKTIPEESISNEVK